MPTSAEITLKNLLTAFEGESNAHAKYAAFAGKADEEGLHGIASLFRAASRAEEIHAANHAGAIVRLGGEPKCEIHPAAIETTAKNLKTALAGETYEVETMYPEFLAQVDNEPTAERTFNFAFRAEKTHIRLYTAAIAALAAGEAWIKEARSYAVCPTCGHTVESIAPQERCPTCRVPGERFETIR
jgi:rubrerythrin